ALDHVGGRGIRSEELTEVEPPEQPGEQRSQCHRQDQREAACREEDDHRVTSAKRCARWSRPEPFIPFTRTTSFSRNSSRRKSYASSSLPTRTDSPSHEPSRPAAL